MFNRGWAAIGDSHFINKLIGRRLLSAYYLGTSIHNVACVAPACFLLHTLVISTHSKMLRTGCPMTHTILNAFQTLLDGIVTEGAGREVPSELQTIKVVKVIVVT